MILMEPYNYPIQYQSKYVKKGELYTITNIERHE